MKTIQMTIDEKLLQDVDTTIKKIKTSRSEFIRKAMQLLLNQMKARELEKQHQAGYKKYPVGKDEFDVWENEQSWG